jgi:hypothetical protein
MNPMVIRRLTGAGAVAALVSGLSYIAFAQKVSPTLALLSIFGIYASLIIMMEIMATRPKPQRDEPAKPTEGEAPQAPSSHAVGHFHIDRHDPT